MSLDAMLRVIEHSELMGEDYVVLLMVAEHENDHEGLGECCWPSVTRIARRAHVSLRTARRALRTAERSGELATEVGSGPGGVNIYRLKVGLTTPGQPDRPPATEGLSTPASLTAKPRTRTVSSSSSTNDNDNPQAVQLCTLLADLIENNGSLRPTVGARWVRDARLMLERDGRELEAAALLMRWTQADTFWRSNVMSMGKFRARYDQLRLARERDLAASGLAGTIATRYPGEVDVDALDAKSRAIHEATVGA